MRRILLVTLLVAMLFSACAAGAETGEYTSKNISCNDDNVYALESCNGILYGLFASGLYMVEPSGEKMLLAASSEFPNGIAHDDGLRDFYTGGAAMYMTE